MKLKVKLLSTLCLSILISAVVCCAYNFTYLYKSAVKNEFESQKKYSMLVSNALDLKLKEPNDQIEKIVNQIAFTQLEAVEKFHQFYKKQDLLDFSTFQYFAISNASNQLFEANEVPKGENCLAMYKIPESKQTNVKNALLSKKVSFDNLWCTIDKDQAFLGYRILNIADKNFLYLQKINSSDLYVEKSSFDKIKSLDLNSFLYKEGFAQPHNPTAVIILSPKGKLLNSNLDKNVAVSYTDSILKDDFESAMKDNQLKQIDLENTKDNKAKIVTVTYQPEYKVFIVVATNKGPIIRKEVISIFLIAAMAISVLALMVFIILKLLSMVNKDLKGIETNISVLKTIVLDPKETTEQTISKVDVAKFSLDKLDSVYNAVADYAKEVNSCVEKKIDELNTLCQNSVKEAVENKELSMISSFHKDMAIAGSDMPNSKFLDIASFLVPAKTDPKAFYDIFRVDKDNIGIVFGKTSESSLKSISAINLITSFVKDALTHKNLLPAQTLTDVNHILMQRNLGDLNITCFVMILSEFTGNFIYSMAGLNLPTLIHLHKEQKLEAKAIHAELCTNKDEVYIDSKGKFTYLDTLVFVNKDITDLKDEQGNEFTLEKIIEMFTEKADDEASDQLISFYRELKKHAGADFESLNKDVSAIVIKKNANNKEFE
ncbi:MAG: SpoIIE family protein phosphatase [Succinivibrio sp.]|nr:SpoIIE family protein phosphatase [Succinivibrio sp.]